ncbi:MAG: TonB-dependent receptor [Novosphingobium sp.]|nr:TonB-dependent receptor [Novosphingobium sp.]
MTITHNRILLSSCAFAALAFGSGSAMAQSGGADASSDDIVVTARRVSESLQSVPVAITAFSQDTLKERAISNSYDLAKSVPGLVTNADSGNSSLPSFSIRGRGQVFGAASGSVETYFADVPLSPPFQMPTLPPQYFDLASAQVLKGPQGTLFGRNTTGGAVLFVPQAPTDQFEGYVRAQLGDYSNRQLEAAVNFPLGEIGALRLAGFMWKRDGYAKTVGGRQDAGASANNGAVFNPATGEYSGPGVVTMPSIDIYNQDVLEFRGSLLLRPTESIENTTIVTWHGSKNRGSIQLEKLRAGAALAGAIGAYYPNLLPNNPRIADVNVDLRRPRSNVWAFINTTLWDLSDALRVKNIISYIDAEGYGNNPSDVDGSPFPAVNLFRPGRPLRNKQFYEELQLQGKLGMVDFIVGGSIDKTRQPKALDKMNMPTITFDTGGFDIQFRESRFDSQALFGSLTFHATDALTLTAAARHTWDKVYDRSTQLNNSPTYVMTSPGSLTDPACSAHPTTTCLLLVGQRKFKGWTYNAGVDYKVTDDVMVYGGYRHGYKRGGFNGRGGDLADFGPEKVDDFFVGLKTAFYIGDRKSTFNIEGFWDIYKGAQRSYLDLSGGALVTTIQNVPKQRYRGFDTDMVLNLTDWFRLAANYTYVDAKYTKYPDVTVAGAIAMLQATGAPQAFIDAFAARNPVVNNSLTVNKPGLNSKHKFNIQGKFHRTLDNGVEIALLPSMTYQSKFYINDGSFRIPAIAEVLFNGAQPVNAAADGANTVWGYKTYDMRLEFNNIADRLDVSFNATNLTNKTYAIGGAGIWQFGVNTLSYGAPRMFFAEARLRF